MSSDDGGGTIGNGKEEVRSAPNSIRSTHPSLIADTSPALQIIIRDVKTSSNTFLNGKRLSIEGHGSEPFELKSDDIVVSLFYPFCVLPPRYLSCAASSS
ncbi:hypothetical protein D9619_013756 [Psilocybe cf. subviscida]|uniref:FHA domain-containing protein n=1 Tax=Psilocybe cf. subviscida TaxID=2480587 RepID=A0A8H5AZK4_9AGAR|nr:hypothetical protein D9619_013740 [Psilocybe cf. subviscida]KAF5313890.1 hypothetical protein D9619_012995 [Psilocybe cf. subviscida]KAF5323191.1 hypothetical protein D9619_013756 [Psilocybe cf. subviscida]